MSKRSYQNALSIENRNFQRKVERYRSISKFAIVDSAGNLPADVKGYASSSRNGDILVNSEEEENEDDDEMENMEVCDQKEILATILDNQNKILENQKKLHQRIDNLERHIKENVADHCVLIANSHTTRECKVLLQRLQKTTMRLTGEAESELQTDIIATFPLSTMEDIMDVEEKLLQPEYLREMKIYLFQLKGCKGTVDGVFRKIMKDELINLFNFDGRMEKRALVQLTLVNKLLSEVFAAEGRTSFDKQLRKAVELSHNRFKVKLRGYARKTNFEVVQIKQSNE